MAILFHFEDVKKFSLERNKIKSWIKSSIEAEEKKLGDVNFIFCSDDYLLDVNRQYLNHDYYTDIITFDYVEDRLISGDLFISCDRVVENAETFQVKFDEEMRRMLIHGVLHLLGYKDKEPADKELMTSKENFYLAKFS
ncbi:MAG: rRNA maturation RNase YbeY [Mangrovibacterium sp.]